MSPRLTCVVVKRPDLHAAQTCVGQGGTNVILNQIRRFVGIDVHGRVARLAVQRLVLNGNGVNGRANVIVRIDVVHKVLGKVRCDIRAGGWARGEIAIVQIVASGVAVDVAVELHPSRWAPRGSENLRIAVQILHTREHVGHGVAPASKVESVEVRIGRRSTVIVGVGRVSRQIRGTNGVPKETEARTLGSHKVV